MKHHSKWIATVLSVAGGLVIANSVQAQPWQTPPPAGTYITTVLSDFANFNLTAQYGSWAAFPAGNATITSGTTPGSFEVAGNSYGSGAKDLAGGPLNASGAWYAQLTFTVNDSGYGPNDPTLGNINPQFDINSAGAVVAYTGAGPGYAAGTTYTFTVPLNADAAAAIGQTLPGTVNTSTIYGFNLENAGYTPSGNYDVTYKSLVLLTPAPEPTTMALLGLGAMAGLVIARRRTKVS